MAWSLTFGFQTGSDLVFAVTDTDKAMPIVTPQWRFEHGASQPPDLSRVIERWEIRDAYYLADSTTADMIDDFKANVVDALQDPADKVNEVILKLDGTAKFTISTATHDSFRVVEIVPGALEAAAGASFVKFSITIEAVKHVAASTAQLEYRYGSARGFETRSLTAKVTTPNGTSAATAARTAAALALPSSKWRYTTAGPTSEVEVTTNQADTEATGTCSIQEQGLSLPSGVYEYERETVEDTTADGTKITLTVTAQGASAESVVRGQRPSGVKTSTIRYNEALQTASAVYVTEEPPERAGDDAVYRRDRVFSVSGGGRPRTDTPISGRPEQWTTFGARKALILTEQLTVQARGITALDQILTDRILFPDRFDLDRSYESLPKRIEAGIEAEGDLWERSATRVYVFADGQAPTPADIFAATYAAAQNQSETGEGMDFEAAG